MLAGGGRAANQIEYTTRYGSASVPVSEVPAPYIAANPASPSDHAHTNSAAHSGEQQFCSETQGDNAIAEVKKNQVPISSSHEVDSSSNIKSWYRSAENIAADFSGDEK